MKIKTWIRRLRLRFSIIRELLTFFWQHKLWWMIPMVLVFLLLGLFIIFTQSAAVVPFIYTLF